jgi:hypothetical protein
MTSFVHDQLLKRFRREFEDLKFDLIFKSHCSGVTSTTRWLEEKHEHTFESGLSFIIVLSGGIHSKVGVFFWLEEYAESIEIMKQSFLEDFMIKESMYFEYGGLSTNDDTNLLCTGSASVDHTEPESILALDDVTHTELPKTPSKVPAIESPKYPPPQQSFHAVMDLNMVFFEDQVASLYRNSSLWHILNAWT